MEYVRSGETTFLWLRVDAIVSRGYCTLAEAWDLSLEEFSEIGLTIRLAQQLEDRREQRNLAAVTYAIYYRDQPKNKTPRYDKYLKDMRLDQYPEKYFLGVLDSEKNEQGRIAPVAPAEKPGESQVKPPEDNDGRLSDEEIERRIEAGTWEGLNISVLQDYKARKAASEESQ